MRKKKINSTINLLVNNKIETDQTTIANKFNDFFSNIGPELSKKIPATSLVFNDFLKIPNPNSMFFSPTSSEEVLKFIKMLDVSINNPSLR